LRSEADAGVNAVCVGDRTRGEMFRDYRALGCVCDGECVRGWGVGIWVGLCVPWLKWWTPCRDVTSVEVCGWWSMAGAVSVVVRIVRVRLEII